MTSFSSWVFALCAGLVVFSSLAVVGTKNPVRATLWLIFSFAPTAVIYLLLSAPFVGILQILVYAGAILMLFTFVIMMINPNPTEGEVPAQASPFFSKKSLPNWYYLGGLILTASIILPFVHRQASLIPQKIPTKADFGSLKSIATLIYQNPLENSFTLSFELISILIMAGIVASLHYSRKWNH